MLEDAVNRLVLQFEDEPKEKSAHRKHLMANLFTLARAQQMVMNDERGWSAKNNYTKLAAKLLLDADDLITMEAPKKFERANKRRKKARTTKKGGKKANSANTSQWDSRLTQPSDITSEDVKPTSAKMIKSQSLQDQQRHDSAPKIHAWTSPLERHEGNSGNMCYAQPGVPSPHVQLSSQFSQPENPSPGLQTSNQHMMHFAPQYAQAQSVDSRYSSFDGSAIEASTPSPMTPYPNSATTAGSMQMMYSRSSQPIGLGFQPPANVMHHGLPTPEHGQEMMSEMMLPHRPNMTAVYSAVTEGTGQQRAPTPAYLPPQEQPFAPQPYYS